MKKSSKSVTYNQELTIEENSIKIKIFNYFYLILISKNHINIGSLYILYILEIFQLISYAFSSPHILTWKLSSKSMKIIPIIPSAFRIFPITQFLSNRANIIIFIVLVIFNIVFSILIIMQIILRKSNSNIFDRLLKITHILIPPLTIFFYIPFIEIYLSPLFCYSNSKNCIFNSEINILFAILGIICCSLFTIILIVLNYFYFYPFQTIKSTVKINSSIDIILIIIKLLYILRYIFIINEYLSIVILLLFFTFLSFEQYKSPIYNLNSIEILLNVRNCIIVWTYFMLLVSFKNLRKH